MSATDHHGRQWHLGAVLRGDTEKVRFLELYFDLVFVLGFTQCTALMVHEASWRGIVQGMLVLAMLWWAWGAYAWLTSVVDPEEGGVRIAMFTVMAALLVVALTVPEAFDDLALTFALAYGAVRIGHITLFALASRDTPDLRHSVTTLSVSTVIAIGLLTVASFSDGSPQAALWMTAVLIDFGAPAIFGVAGWRLVPAHFAERHGLIIILALGESIVVLGAGASAGVTGRVIVVAVLGVALASALWWTYFDVVALITERRLSQTTPGRERNALAIHSYSYLHLPMAAGIVLAAVGLENTIAHVDDPLEPVAAFSLLGGVALYLLAHVALRSRNARSVNWQRLALAVVLLASTPLATRPTSLATLGAVTAALWGLIAYETHGYGPARDDLRHGDDHIDTPAHA